MVADPLVRDCTICPPTPPQAMGSPQRALGVIAKPSRKAHVLVRSCVRFWSQGMPGMTVGRQACLARYAAPRLGGGPHPLGRARRLQRLRQVHGRGAVHGGSPVSVGRPVCHRGAACATHGVGSYATGARHITCHTDLDADGLTVACSLVCGEGFIAERVEHLDMIDAWPVVFCCSRLSVDEVAHRCRYYAF